jgi:hypothetical protein
LAFRWFDSFDSSSGGFKSVVAVNRYWTFSSRLAPDADEPLVTPPTAVADAFCWVIRASAAWMFAG